MKRLFLLSAIALVAICSSACDSSLTGTPTKPEAPERQGWEEVFPLYGDVESVVMTEYKLEEKFGEVVRGDFVACCGIYRFNDAGDVIEDVGYFPDGSLDEKEIFKYDSSGNMIEKARYYSDGSLDDKYIYKYDSRGNVIEATGYVGEALIPESLTVYEITYRN